MIGKTQYQKLGKKILHEGKILWQFGYSNTGVIYKDEEAFECRRLDICYIPESAFYECPEIEINGEFYYEIDKENRYSRDDLEQLLKPVYKKLHIEASFDVFVRDFFDGLDRACPEIHIIDELLNN